MEGADGSIESREKKTVEEELNGWLVGWLVSLRLAVDIYNRLCVWSHNWHNENESVNAKLWIDTTCAQSFSVCFTIKNHLLLFSSGNSLKCVRVVLLVFVCVYVKMFVSITLNNYFNKYFIVSNICQFVVFVVRGKCYFGLSSFCPCKSSIFIFHSFLLFFFMLRGGLGGCGDRVCGSGTCLYFGIHSNEPWQKRGLPTG